MRRAILTFVLGVASLQRLATLPGQTQLICLVVAALACLVIATLSKSFFVKLRPDNPAASQFATDSGRLVQGIAILLCCYLAGFSWATYRAQLHAANELPRQFEQVELVVQGVITSLPSGDEQARHFQFQLLNLPADMQSAWPSAVEVNLAWYGQAACGLDLRRLAAGQRWQLPIRLRRPHGPQNPGGFDYELWLFEQNLRASAYVSSSTHPGHCDKIKQLASATPGWQFQLQNLRGALRDKIEASLPGYEYTQVLVALVIGEQRGIPQAQWQLFNRSGIGHLISISGLHITMLASLAATLAGLIWRWAARRRFRFCLNLPRQYLESLVAIVVAFAYTAIAGFGVPAQRTLIMLVVYGLCRLSGRHLAASRTLALALAVVVLIDPWAVLAAGFWLSFAAVGLLIYGSQPASSEVRSGLGKLWRELKQAARAQYLITLGMLPLSILLFSEVSLISPLANALAIPLISLLVTPFALLGVLLPLPFASWCLQLAHAVLKGLMMGIIQLTNLPVISWIAPAPDYLCLALAVAGVLYLLAPRGLPARYLGFIACLPLLFQPVKTPLYGQFRVQFIDVGQGMAVLLETADHRLLYDTGPAYLAAQDAGSRIILPYLRQRGIASLDMLMISHNDSDHSGGMASVLRQIRVGQLRSSLTPGQLQAKLPESVARQPLPDHLACQAGQTWQWDGVSFELLHPGSGDLLTQTNKANARSCVLRVSNGQRSLLLAGDIEAAQEQTLLARYSAAQLRAEVLLVPHHGSGTSSTPAFIAAVRPQIAVFQMAYQNRYRHPKSTVWQRYADFGVTRLRSDAQGAIQIDFASSLSVISQRQQRKRYWFSDVSWLNPDTLPPDGAESDTGRLFTSAYE